MRLVGGVRVMLPVLGAARFGFASRAEASERSRQKQNNNMEGL